jgi:hypothetical protein
MILNLRYYKKNQSLVGLVMIDAELDKKDDSSIPATTIGKGLEPLDVKIDPQTRLN